MPVERIIECLNMPIGRGRIRAFGASNWTYDRLGRANEYADRKGLKGFTATSNNLSLATPA